MKNTLKTRLLLLFVIIAVGFSGIRADGTAEKTRLDQLKSFASNAPLYLKSSSRYLLSVAGAKDIAGAYLLGMGITNLHELAHAVAGKLCYGTPINLTIGATPAKASDYMHIGGITLGGFNPATGFASIRMGDNPLKNAAIFIAGPLCGALCSYAAYRLLSNNPGNYLSKAVALYGLFNHTLGIAGLGGMWLPNQDINRFVCYMKEYFIQA